MALGNCEIMAHNIKVYMQRKNVDRKKLCADLGFKYTTFCDWVNGNAYPRIDKIEMMAEYFGCSKADLVEEHKEPEYDPRLDMVVTDFKKLDERQIRLLLEYMKALKGDDV